MHGNVMTLTGSSLLVCIPVSQPSAHVHGVHVTPTEQINLRSPDTLLDRDSFMDWYLCMRCRGYMQINCILPPVGFIIISHFNEVATDIKTTRSLRVMFHRGSVEPVTRWLRREWLERRSGLPRSARHTSAESTGRTRLDRKSESGKGKEQACMEKKEGDDWVLECFRLQHKWESRWSVV